MLLNIENSGEYDKERSKEWLVNTDPGRLPLRDLGLFRFICNIPLLNSEPISSVLRVLLLKGDESYEQSP